MKKLRMLVSFGWKTNLMFVEAFFYLGWARFLKRLPFAKVAPSLGVKMEETAYKYVPANKHTIKRVSEVVRIMSKYTFWESQCLVQAIAAQKMLERRQIESTLYLGTAKEKNGTFVAHAWLRSGPIYVTGFEVMHQFTVVSTFAKEIEKVKRRTLWLRQ